MKKIKIGYYCADVNPTKTKSLGIYKTTMEILNGLLKNNLFDIILILSKDNEQFFKHIKCKKEICESKFPYFFKKLFIYPSFANKIAKKRKLDILFFPKGHIPFSKVPKVKYISFIYDLIPFYYLKKYLKMILVSLLIWWSAKFSDLIFTCSKFSKNQIKKITKKKIVIVPLGCKKVKPSKRLFDKEYVFIIGNKNPHKNLNKSINLIKEYNKKFNKNYFIVFSLEQYSENELAGLYKYAKFSLFLSSIEGFGLPLIESYSYGTPVVFNNKTALAEIGKGLPGSCNINNKESIFKAIKEIEKLNKKQIKEIAKKLLKKYNWNNCLKIIFNEIISLFNY